MTFPTNAFKAVEFEQVDDVRVTTDRLYANRARGSKATYFRFALATPPTPYNQGMRIGAKLAQYQSGLKVFTLPNPLPPIGNQAAIQLDGVALTGSTSIDVTGISGTIYAGDFIRIAGSTKCYMVAEDTTTSPIELTSELVQTYANDSAVDYGVDVDFQVSLSANASMIKVGANQSKFISYDIEVIEQI